MDGKSNQDLTNQETDFQTRTWGKTTTTKQDTSDTRKQEENRRTDENSVKMWYDHTTSNQLDQPNR